MERITFKDLPKGFINNMLASQAYVENCGLDHNLLGLVKMRASQINSCAYCIDMHFKEGIHRGETAQRLVSVSAWRETNYYSPQEQAALAFTERLTHMPMEEHSDDIHNALSKYFSKVEIANLTLAVIQINAWNRLTRSFGSVAGTYQVPAEKATA